MGPIITQVLGRLQSYSFDAPHYHFDMPTKPPAESFAVRIRRLRLECGFESQQALADRVKRTQAWVSKMEQGLLDAENIEYKNLLELARALRTSIHELVTGRPDNESVAGRLDEQDRRFLEDYLSLGPAGRASVRERAHQLRSEQRPLQSREAAPRVRARELTHS